jgi:predicted O-methyltransferase YrrM
VDNVVRKGATSDPRITDDDRVEGVRNLLKAVKDDHEVEATTISTVGEKGWDGFMYAVRL